MPSIEIELDTKQIEAVSRCIDLSPKNRLVGVNGKAGTGKTTILKKAKQTLADAGYSVALSAPTGKAARRVTEATGFPASTLHKLLEFPRPHERDEETGKFLDETLPKRNKHNPLTFDVIFVDEASMITAKLYRQLIDAMKPGSHVRFFGDANQLPPVEPFTKGTIENYDEVLTPFETVLKNFRGVTLETIHRQAEGSGIVTNGDRILKGQMPQRFDDFYMMMTSNDHVGLLRQHVMRTDGQYFGRDCQIIIPGNQGKAGVRAINGMLQNIKQGKDHTDWLTLPRHHKKIEPIRVRAGDKVIISDNIYGLPMDPLAPDTPPFFDLMNGDIGIIDEVDDFGIMYVNFDHGRYGIIPEIRKEYEGENYYQNVYKSIDLAYAITTHKAQGSEFREICYMLHPSFIYYLCNRANFYTAVTRAKEKVNLIACSRTLVRAVREPGRSSKI